MSEVVLAAGALCWRKNNGKYQLLLVHRPYRQDISFPKGKVDPGESLPEAAVRELKEETGLSVHLGAKLAVSKYMLPNGKPKEVHYWAVRVRTGQIAEASFSPNNEVDELRWVSFDEAKRQLSYRKDAELIDDLAERIAKNTADTFAVIALRHGKAELLEPGNPDDFARPLREKGKIQSEQVAKIVSCWAPRKIYSSPALRCIQTVAPLSLALDIRAKVTESLGQSEDNLNREGSASVVQKIIAAKKDVLLCSHAPMIPKLLSQFFSQTGSGSTRTLIDHASLDTAEFVVLHLSKTDAAKIVAIERYGPRSIIR